KSGATALLRVGHAHRRTTAKDRRHSGGRALQVGAASDRTAFAPRRRTPSDAMNLPARQLPDAGAATVTRERPAPRVLAGTTRMFESNVLEFFSRVHPATPAVVYLPLAAYCL